MTDHDQLGNVKDQERTLDMELTEAERWILSNQFEILKRLSEPEEAEEFALDREVVECGYSLLYNDSSMHIYPATPQEVCQEVVDILDMFRALQRCYAESDEKPAINKHDIEFLGFDGNNESTMFSFAKFFMLRMDRFEELAESLKGDLNSHMPMLQKYRPMLQLWKSLPSEKRYRLRAEDIERIANAPIQEHEAR